MKRPLLLLAAAGALLLSGMTVYALSPFGGTEQIPEKDLPALVISWDDLISQEAEVALDQQIKELEQAILNAQKPLSQSIPSDEGSTALDAMNALPAEGSEGDVGMSTSMQIGTFHTVADLNNEKVRLPGFIVPFNFEEEGMISEFLFVPFVGACIHVPPPPPNQIVYVTSKKPVAFSSLWDPMWIEGTLTTQRHENVLGNTAYTLQLDKLEPYDE